MVAVGDVEGSVTSVNCAVSICEVKDTLAQVWHDSDARFCTPLPGLLPFRFQFHLNNNNRAVEEAYSVEVPSGRGSSQWIIGCADNRSGFGEEDDNNTGEVEERDGEEVLSVACSKRRTMTRGWRDAFRRTTRLEPSGPLSLCTHVICAVWSVEWLYMWRCGVRQVYLSTGTGSNKENRKGTVMRCVILTTNGGRHMLKVSVLLYKKRWRRY